ncbi:MAG TPA: DUF3857 domain-containing protein, partial [Lacunisphaera sp.]|nr:DUF3857 domain-containing protein [Lacunisphaera sp.]
MPHPAARLVLTAFCLVATLTLQAEPVSRNPPELYTRQLAALLTPLDQVLAGRDAFKDSKAHGVILLDETVHFRDEAGVDYLVYHDVYLARSDSAREFMGNRIYSYDREHDSIYLISAATIRPDGERQNLDDRAAFIQTPQREAENGLYTSEQELNLIFPNIAPGAVTQTIVVIREDKPVFPGEFSTRKLFAAGWPTYRSRLVVDFPTAAMARMHVVETSPKLPQPSTEILGERTRQVWSQDLINEMEWEESAPALRFRAPAVWLTTIDSWDRIAAWFAGLTKGRDELGPELEKELARVTAGLTDRRAIVDRLCALVANEVRYTGLEFGLAGYQPYPCAQVWTNRYGDCKDKANLLRALLARQGIAAHFLLLHTGRLGRVEQRSPSWKQFNHVILAVEDGAGGYWYCDPTIRYLPAGMIGLGDAARNVMLVRDDKAEWRQTPDALDNALRYGAELTLSPTGELAGWFTLQAEGADAAAYADYYNNYKPSDRRRTLQSTIEDFYPGAEVVDVDYEPVTESLSHFKIRAYFLRKAGGTALESVPFPYPADWLPSADTASERIFPYATTRRVQSFDATITLPAGWNAAQLPSSFQADSPAANFTASWQADASVLRMRLNWHPKAAELPARDYAVFQRSVRALRTWLGQPAQIARGAVAAGPSHGALDNFPILPTGEGQLRLLGERFPSGERDAERRAALERILQWFPEDHATTFTARIYLALLAAGEDNAALARRLGEILSQYDARVSAESRAWARYLQSRAQWWSDKDPSALQTLRTLSADSTLSDYRRAWCAHYAALFLAESDPAAALTLLADWDIQPSEARESMLKAEAGYLAGLSDPTVTAAWAARLLARQAADADSLIAITLGEALARKDRFPPAAFEHLNTAIRPLLADGSQFPKSLALLDDLQAVGDAGRQRREFTAGLAAWLKQHPQPWIARERSPRFADLAALEKHLDA